MVKYKRLKAEQMTAERFDSNARPLPDGVLERTSCPCCKTKLAATQFYVPQMFGVFGGGTVVNDGDWIVHLPHFTNACTHEEFLEKLKKEGWEPNG